MKKLPFRAFSISALAVFAVFAAACGGVASNSSVSGPVDPNATAATVNGKVIKMEDVERAVKQQTQGQDSKLSPLELTGARLEALQSLIEQEVMYQKAEKEGEVPSEDEITAEINNRKTQSGKSADQIAKEMSGLGVTEAALRDSVKKELAIQELIKKITGKIESPKDSEIDAFYNGNKDAFVKKRGVRLAAIVIDPASSGAGDTTTDEQSAVLRGNEIIKKLQAGQDFATLAREYSEDQSRLQGGDLGHISEEQMRQTFPAGLIATLMNPDTQLGKLLTSPIQGRFYILKLQDRTERDEALTLESPDVRKQVTDSLVNNRKQLLAASYQAIAMNEAKIENFLARRVVENPNELSGARPAAVGTAAASPTTAANLNANVANAPVNAAANSAAKPAANSAANTNK